MPASGTIVEQRTGKDVGFDALVAALSKEGGPAVVYVGEGHDQAAHHAFQAKVLDAVTKDARGPIAFGLEMFYKPYQSVLDDYVAGTIDEKTMLEKTEWKTRWGYHWEMYAPMLRICRERKIPVIALNAPKEITRTVSQKGLDGLTTEQRATLPPLDMTDAAHRAFVKRAFEGHGPGMKPEVFERFYTSMVIWDEVMSSSVADWLQKAGDGARMVVIAGNGHIADRYGIPSRAARKSKKPYATIVQEILDKDGSLRGERRTDTTYADYTAWWTESAPPEPILVPKPKSKPAAEKGRLPRV